MAKRLYRSRDEKMIGGVCGGLAQYLDVDPTLIRVLWVVVTVMGAGTGLLAYLILWVLIPQEPVGGI
jgi:phage shock protein C